MGTLDEAIRQHLELKRRRGATDSELQRLEDEAFGPPSRPGEPDFPEHEGGSAEQSGNGAMADAHAEPDQHEVAEAETTIYEEPHVAEPEVGEVDLELDEEEAPAEQRAVAEEPADSGASEPPIEALDTVEHELPERQVEPAGEGGPSEPEPEPEPEPEAGAEEEASEEAEAGQRDDMLADTPDFLKDAPEDDELWFEQGKPKDFDF
jgi:hypothetical protein